MLHLCFRRKDWVRESVVYPSTPACFWSDARWLKSEVPGESWAEGWRPSRQHCIPEASTEVPGRREGAVGEPEATVILTVIVGGSGLSRV